MNKQDETRLGSDLTATVKAWLEDMLPEDLFNDEELDQWATENGYVKNEANN